MLGKFRVYDKKYNKMHIEMHKFLMCYDGNLILKDDPMNDYNTEYSCLDNGRYIKMFYTGLKDKNDKNIYFDDIVRIKYKMGFKFAIETEEDLLMTAHARVILYEGVIMADLPLMRQKGYALHCFDKEVIGNFYQNPELLQQENIK